MVTGLVQRKFWHSALGEFLSSKHVIEPTDIQRSARDIVKSGANALLLAETGTGKTFGYLLPIVERLLEEGPRHTLVLVPTFELENQIRSLISELGSVNKMISNCFQVCTPGKLAHRESRLELFKLYQTIVLDEADILLGGATESLLSYFVNDAIGIERRHRPFQWVFVAATWPRHVSNLVDRRWKNMIPVRSNLLHKPVTTLSEHYEYLEDEASRQQKLIEILAEKDNSIPSTLIFVNTRDSAEQLYVQLKDLFSIDRVHNGLEDKAYREKILQKFRYGTLRNLICTDSMSRGMDLNVSRVIQYEFAKNAIDYLHRIGRTARSGLQGTVHHLVMPMDEPFVEYLRSQLSMGLEPLFSRKRSFTKRLKRISKPSSMSTKSCIVSS